MTPIRRLGPADAASFRTLRLHALRTEPASFGMSCAEEEALPAAAWPSLLESAAVFAAEGRDGALLGSAGLRVEGPEKLRHKGTVWGVYVRPEARGTGLAPALLAAVLAHAATVVEEVRLTVSGDNPAAVALYARAGFVAYGRDVRGLKIGAEYYPELLMALSLPR